MAMTESIVTVLTCHWVRTIVMKIELLSMTMKKLKHACQVFQINSLFVNLRKFTLFLDFGGIAIA